MKDKEKPSLHTIQKAVALIGAMGAISGMMGCASETGSTGEDESAITPEDACEAIANEDSSAENNPSTPDATLGKVLRIKSRCTRSSPDLRPQGTHIHGGGGGGGGTGPG